MKTRVIPGLLFRCSLFFPPHPPNLLVKSTTTMPSNPFRKPSEVVRQPRSELPGLRLLPDLPHIRRPYGTQDAELVVGPVGRVYGPSGVFGQVPGEINLAPVHIEGDDIPEDMGPDEEEAEDVVDNESTLKAKRLWQRWSEEVIPQLLEPYFDLLRETKNLRVMDKVRSRAGCRGCTNGRLIEISCVFFESTSSRSWLCLSH